MRKLSPCFECEDRKLGCHGWCGKYEKFTAENEEARKAESDAKKGHNMMVEYISQQNERLRARTNKRREV